MLHFNVSHVVGSINIKSILTIPLLFYATKFAYPREVAVSEGDVPLDHIHRLIVVLVVIFFTNSLVNVIFNG